MGYYASHTILKGVMELREPFTEAKIEPFREYDVFSGTFDPLNDPFEHCEPTIKVPKTSPKTQVCSPLRSPYYLSV